MVFKMKGFPKQQTSAFKKEGILKEAKNVSMPKMPKNPLTGEQFNMATGGL